MPLKILNAVKQMNEFLEGGNLTTIELGNSEYAPEALFSITQHALKDGGID